MWSPLTSSCLILNLWTIFVSVLSLSVLHLVMDSWVDGARGRMDHKFKLPHLTNPSPEITFLSNHSLGISRLVLPQGCHCICCCVVVVFFFGGGGGGAEMWGSVLKGIGERKLVLWNPGFRDESHTGCSCFWLMVSPHKSLARLGIFTPDFLCRFVSSLNHFFVIVIQMYDTMWFLTVFVSSSYLTESWRGH